MFLEVQEPRKVVRRRATLAAAGALVLVITVGGCTGASPGQAQSTGGAAVPSVSSPVSSRGGTSSSGSGTPAGFVASADDICTRSGEDVARIPVPGDSAAATVDQLPDWSSYFQRILPPIEQEHTELAALPRPEAQAQQIEQLLAQHESAIEELRALERAAAAGDLAAYQAALGTFGLNSAEAARTAAAIGLVECAKR